METIKGFTPPATLAELIDQLAALDETAGRICDREASREFSRKRRALVAEIKARREAYSGAAAGGRGEGARAAGEAKRSQRGRRAPGRGAGPSGRERGGGVTVLVLVAVAGVIAGLVLLDEIHRVLAERRRGRS